MPFLFRIIAPLLFLCSCLLGFMAIGGLGNIDLKVAQVCVAVCIALSLLAGVLFRFSFTRTPIYFPVGSKGGEAGQSDNSLISKSATSSAPLAAKVAAPAQEPVPAQ